MTNVKCGHAWRARLRRDGAALFVRFGSAKKLGCHFDPETISAAMFDFVHRSPNQRNEQSRLMARSGSAEMIRVTALVVLAVSRTPEFFAICCLPDLKA